MVMQDSFPTAGQALSGWIGYQRGHGERFQLFRVLLSQALLGAIGASNIEFSWPAASVKDLPNSRLNPRSEATP
jgi:hypothetical protein